MPDPRDSPLQVDPSERAGGETATTRGAEVDDTVEQNDKSKEESEPSE